jgi:hypothetical protein
MADALSKNGLSPPDGPGVPDLKWVNRHLPMQDVAVKLDLRFGDTGLIHCWKPEKHKNGDRTASVSIHKKFNTAKCFGCDSKPQSVIDVVIEARSECLNEAVAWLDANFTIPRIAKRKHLDSEPLRRPNRVGYEDPIGLLVRTGIWGTISTSAQRIAPVLLAFAEPDESRRDHFTLQISYRALMRYSGVHSNNAVSAALNELAAIEWARRVVAKPKPGALLRKTGAYVLTPYSDALIEIGNTLSLSNRETISAERELRRVRRNQRTAELRQRNRRSKALQDKVPQSETRITKYESLYPTNSVAQEHGPVAVASNRSEHLGIREACER